MLGASAPGGRYELYVETLVAADPLANDEPENDVLVESVVRSSCSKDDRKALLLVGAWGNQRPFTRL